MKAKIILMMDGMGWEYRMYASESEEQKNRLNRLTEKIPEERGV